MTRLFLVAAALWVLGSAVPAAPPGKFSFVDLKPYANRMLTDNFGSGGEGNNLKALGEGVRTCGGVNFKIGKGALELASRLLQVKRPEKIEGVKVGNACGKIHFLHATQYGNGQVVDGEPKEGDPLYVPDGTKIAEYQIRYADGSTASVPVVYGKDVRDWWFTEKAKGVTRGKVAWEGDNDLAKSNRSRIRLYLTSWNNPHPAKKVESINYVKAESESPAAPFCVAITLEAK
jgi:hypothetical protein